MEIKAISRINFAESQTKGLFSKLIVAGTNNVNIENELPNIIQIVMNATNVKKVTVVGA